MKKSTKYIAGFVTAAALFSAVLAGCGNKASDDKKAEATVGDLKVAYDNKGKAVKNGTLNVAMIQDTPFDGIFASELSNSQTDSYLAEPLTAVGGSIFATNDAFKIVDGGAADLKLDKATKTAVITLHKDLKWSDGKPVTAKDLEFAYELTANPAYGSSRYTDSLANIQGLADFNKGKAKTISGLTYPKGENGNQLKIQFDKMTPGMWQSGSGYYLESVEPFHYLKGIEPKKLAASKELRQTPLSYGPYKVSKVVAGQSVTYVPNEYYYGSKAKLKQITTSVVSTSSAAAALKAKKYDVAYQAPSTAYPSVKALKDYVQTGQESLSFSYMAFNLGHFDAKKSENVMDRKTPVQDKNLRQAMGYAMNVDEVNKKFNNGLATRANSTIVPVFKEFNDKDVKGFPLDLKKANSILDKAGYKWQSGKEGDGYRLDKDGKPFKLVYFARSGSSNAEAVAQNYLQQWKKIGVHVTLYHDRLQDFNTWAQVMTTGTAQDWDLMGGSWSVSSDPSQMDLYSKVAPYNFGHFTTPELTKLLDDVDSQSSLTQANRKEAFNKYQQYMQDQAAIIPTSFSLDWFPVNERVIGWTNSHSLDQTRWADIAVSADKTK